jgi:hypothetical protein
MDYEPLTNWDAYPSKTISIQRYMNITSLSTFGGHGRTLLHFATIDVASLPVMSRFVGQNWGGQMINGGFLKWGFHF